MTLYFENPETQGEGPQTHALVIGVGGYPHLSNPDVIEQVGLLNELTSPPRSAIAFAEFMKETHRSWLPPVGTIELVLSAAKDDDCFVPENATLDATLDTVKKAFQRWFERCNQNEDNMSVFYFCGHGVEKQYPILLTEDFGENAGNPFDGAFNFLKTKLAMFQCKARRQLHFVDACRITTKKMEEYDVGAQPLRTPKSNSKDPGLLLHARGAARNELAYGPENDVSYFTQALIKTLGGVASEESHDGSAFEVKTTLIQDKIEKIMDRFDRAAAAEKSRTSVENTDSGTILRLDEPICDLQVVCAPFEATDHAQLSCRFAGDGQLIAHESECEPLKVEVPRGIYDIAARFQQAVYKDASERIAVDPSIRIQRLQCQQ